MLQRRKPAFERMKMVDRPPMWEYNGSMKVKTSITLSQELLKAVDKRTRQQKRTRSDLIEAAVEAFLQQLARDEQNARDLDIINRRADSLNKEAANVLEYQVLP